MYDEIVIWVTYDSRYHDVNFYVLENINFLYYLSRLVALIHLLYVLFVFLGIAVIYIGELFKIKFVRNIWFRTIHLIAMIIVAIQQYFLINCPLTILEKNLLLKSGNEVYDGAFVAHMINTYHLNIPTSYYLPLYIGLSVLFMLTFLIIPPKIKKPKIRV